MRKTGFDSRGSNILRARKARCVLIHMEGREGFYSHA